MDKNIILKIKKLLALAEGNSNINESLAAAAAANKLMFEYRLTKENLNLPEEKLFDYSDKIGRPWLNLKNPDEIMQALASMIASWNNCGVYIRRWKDAEGECSGLSIVGQPVDILAAENMFWFLLSQLMSLANDPIPKNKLSFWMGAMQKIKERIEEEKRITNLKNLNLNESEIKMAIYKIDERTRKINEYIASISREKFINQLVNVNDFNFGYVKADKINLFERKMLS